MMQMGQSVEFVAMAMEGEEDIKVPTRGRERAKSFPIKDEEDKWPIYKYYSMPEDFHS